MTGYFELLLLCTIIIVAVLGCAMMADAGGTMEFPAFTKKGREAQKAAEAKRIKAANATYQIWF